MTQANKAASAPFNIRLADWLSIIFVLVIIFLAANGPVSALIDLCGDWFGKEVRIGLNKLIKPIKSNIWRSDGFKLGFPVLISMTMLFLTLFAPDNALKRTLNWLLAAATVLLFGYWIGRYYYGSTGEVQTMLWFDFPIMIGAFLLLLFITERKYGAILAGFIVLWFIYPFSKHLFPEWTILYGSFKGFEQTLARIGNDLWLGTDGVFGAPLKVISSEILIFIVFGSVLMATGAGDLLLKIANRATGALVGGAAHAAVAGSALFGMMSGAAISNVVSTGVMTIPVIKKAGFRPSFAGAVEASASTGGQIMPPVMGVVAFFIVSQTGIAYKFIMVAAIFPALFYYIALFMTIYFEARRLAIGKMSQAPSLSSRERVQSLVFVVPLIVLIYFLFSQPSPRVAGFYAFWAALACALILFPRFRSWQRVLGAFRAAGYMAASIIVVVAAIGIIVGLINQTGIGNDFGRLLNSLTGDNIFVILLITAFGALALGMGLPPGATYFLIILSIGNSMAQLDVPLLTIHLFVVYYAVMSTVTPPVALAAYAAAPIAGAHPIRTGFDASRLSAAGFIIPFMFYYHPAILYKPQEIFVWITDSRRGRFPERFYDIQQVSWFDLGWAIAAFLLAMWLVSSALIGFEKNRLSWIGRIARLLAGGLILMPDWRFALSGLILAVFLVASHRIVAGADSPALSQTC